MQHQPSSPLDAELRALAQDARRRAAERNTADALTRARVDLMIARSYVTGAGRLRLSCSMARPKRGAELSWYLLADGMADKHVTPVFEIRE